MTFFSSRKLLAALVALTSVVGGCSDPESSERRRDTAVIESPAGEIIERNPNRNAYFGDLHVHTQLSLDAYLFGTRATPDDAYLFAKGGALRHTAGPVMQMKKPLDFQAVTDHGIYLGVVKAMVEATDGPFSGHSLTEVFRNISTPSESRAAFAALAAYSGTTMGTDDDIMNNPAVSASAWQEIVRAAERHNDPGNFTTFVGYEYTTGGPKNENLHRNVIFRGADVPESERPSAADSDNPGRRW